MTETIPVAIVSAVSGLLGVAVGTCVPLVREWFADRKRRAYAAIRAVCVLDKFIVDCASSVGQEDSGDDLPVSSWPESLSYPDDIDWRLLDSALTYRALALPNRVAAAANAVAFIKEVASTERDPQHLTTVSVRYVPLGIEAADLARELRQSYGLPEKTRDDWEPVEFLQKKARRIAKREP